jgi:hypothetical protein
LNSPIRGPIHVGDVKPLAWQQGRFSGLEDWQQQAQSKILDLAAVPSTQKVPLDWEIESAVDCGSYLRKKISFAGSAAWRIPGYLLIPKGAGPFPGVIAIHDHGAFFYWGKEKVGTTDALQRPGLQQFVDTSYEGQPFGDELARRGFAVIAIDGHFWGERRATGAEETIGGAIPDTVEETRQCNRFLYEW